MALRCVVFLLTTTCFFMANAQLPVQPGFNLTARLKSSQGLVDCWNALIDITSCSNEIVLYFVDSETDISPACCQAITRITHRHRCWSAMMTSLCFTAEEGDILKGYCDASSSATASSPAAQPLPKANLMVMV